MKGTKPKSQSIATPEEHNAATIHKLADKERMRILQAYKDAGLRFGPNFQQAVVLAASKTKDWMDVIFPVAEEEESFDVCAPKLRACTFEEVHKARVVLRCVFHEKLIPCIAKGEEKVTEVGNIAQVIEEMIERYQGMAEVKEGQEMGVMDAVFVELGEALAFLKALPGETVATLATLDTVMQAKEGGMSLLKQTLRQNRYWRETEQRLRQSHVALETMMPEVTKLLQALDSKQKVDWALIVPKYVTWLDALPEANTQKLEDKIKEALRSRRAELKKHGQDNASLKELGAACEAFASSMPTDMRTRAFFVEMAAGVRTLSAELKTDALRARVRGILVTFVKDQQGCKQLMG